MFGFPFDMTAIAAQLKSFQDQSERLVNAVEKIQQDILLIKTNLNILEPSIFQEHVQALGERAEEFLAEGRKRNEEFLKTVTGPDAEFIKKASDARNNGESAYSDSVTLHEETLIKAGFTAQPGLYLDTERNGQVGDK